MPTNSTRVIYEGRLTTDPQTHMDGKLVRFGVAVDDDYRQGDAWVEQTMFLETQAWNGTADRVKKMSLKKGDKVSIIGQLKQSPEYQMQDGKPVLDKDGNKIPTGRTWTKVWAGEINLLVRKGAGQPQAKAARHAQEPGPMSPEELGAAYGPTFPSEASGMDDVPF